MPLTYEQIKERQSYLGGTDCAPVLGLSRWRSPLEVWAEKTGKVPPEDISGKLAVKLGTRLEDTVAQLFVEETGKKVQRVNYALKHADHPFIAANIDRKIVGESAILECKTASAWLAKEWEGEEIPQEYILQCVHYLAVTGVKKAYIAVLIGNQEFKYKEITRDEKLISEIVEKEVAFWTKYVIPGVMPEVIKARDTDVLYKLFPRAEEGKSVDLPDSANAIIESIQSLTQDEKAVKSQKEKLQNELKAMIREGEIGNTGIYKVKWINVHKEPFTVAAQDYRQIRFSAMKKEG